MTHATKRAARQAAFPVAALAGLLLAGCSSGHIGESWQCPLAEGGTCDSVAAADPAVPVPAASGGTVLREPLWRERTAERNIPPAREPACAAECGDGFDPFAWLARLFGAEAVDGEARPAGGSTGSSSATAAQLSEAVPGEDAPAPAAARTEEPATATLPAEPERSEPEAGQQAPAAGDLRTEEIVARIWIAPFVDADGVYREASHVRVVLEPAGWRLP